MHTGVPDVVNAVKSVTADVRRSAMSHRRHPCPFQSRTRGKSCWTDFWWEENG